MAPGARLIPCVGDAAVLRQARFGALRGLDFVQRSKRLEHALLLKQSPHLVHQPQRWDVLHDDVSACTSAAALHPSTVRTSATPSATAGRSRHDAPCFVMDGVRADGDLAARFAVRRARMCVEIGVRSRVQRRCRSPHEKRMSDAERRSQLTTTDPADDDGRRQRIRSGRVRWTAKAMAR